MKKYDRKSKAMKKSSKMHFAFTGNLCLEHWIICAIIVLVFIRGFIVFPFTFY